MQNDHHHAQSNTVSDQLTPDVKYRISLGTGTWEAYASSATPPEGVNSATEYWALDATFLTALSSATAGQTLTLTPSTQAGTVRAAPLTNPVNSVWTSLPSNLFSGNVFVNSTSTIGLAFELTADTPWTGNLWWFSSAVPSSHLISGTSTTTLDLSTDGLPTSASSTWYYLKLPALVWSTNPTSISSNARSGAAMTTMTVSEVDTLFLADIKESNHQVYVHTSTDGSQWRQSAQFGSHADKAPAIASLDGMLYIVYKCRDQETIVQTISNDGSSWSSPTDTGAGTCGSPSLANVEGILTMAYQSGSSPQQIHTRAYDSSTQRWSSFTQAPQSSAALSPALITFDSVLYLAVLTTNSVQMFNPTSVSSSGVVWPATTTPVATIAFPSGVTWTSVSMCLWDEQMVLALKADSDVWLAFSSDGSNWSGFQSLTAQVPSVSTDIAPAAGALNQTLVIASSNDNGFFTENTVVSFPAS